MKKFLSLILVICMIACMLSVSFSANAAAVFNTGDKIYLQVVKPAIWLQDAELYMNFTEFSRADNNDKSVVIADADKTKYSPVTGAVYDSENDVYCYTVKESDKGKSAMRFWRGNSEKLWNCSVVLTADEYQKGNNLVVVDGEDWNDSGYTDKYYDIRVNPSIELSAVRGDIGDSFTATVKPGVTLPQGYEFAYDIKADGTTVSTTDTYTFTADKKGIVSIEATVTALDPTGAVVGAATANASVNVGSLAISAATTPALYAHGVSDGCKDSEAWIKWYTIRTDRYLFMPSSAKKDSIEIFNSHPVDVTIKSAKGNTVIPAGETAVLNVEDGATYTAVVEDKSYNLIIKHSNTEAAVFVNNSDTFDGLDFYEYLCQSKENSASATGAITDKSGNIISEGIKKMKGRGNTSWVADKKGFNLTYNSAVSIASMKKCKKFSIISNFQDASLTRNRLLFDLADAVGVPYSSDSRFVDFYINGEYMGNYQMCEKVDVGKNTLISDVSSDDYLDEATNTVKPDFSFVCEIDPAPSDDDFYLRAANGNNLTMKAPELDSTDPNYSSVKSYIKTKYDKMYQKLIKNAADLNDYIDIESLAQVYIINELGKNWDSGAGSFYFVYKPDENGKYKFFASPVWDYDNSLGNARGVQSDLDRLKINDYTLPTGWFSTKKNGYSGPNFLAQAIKRPPVKEMAVKVWFEQFVPALDTLLKTGVDSGELYSPDVYKSLLKDSADMNYIRWDMRVETDWIADHSSLKKATAKYTYNEYHQVTAVDYKQDATATSYTAYTFDDEYDYMIDWTTSRAAWISSQYISLYKPEPVLPGKKGDADCNGTVDISDATAIQRHLALLAPLPEKGIILGNVDGDEKISILDATYIQRFLAQIIPSL